MPRTPDSTDNVGRTDPERWLSEYGDAMFRYALSRLGERARAEDAVQESLLAALAARKTFRGASAEKTWLFGILKHKILDQFRRSAREALIEDDDEADALIERAFDASGSWRLRPAAWQDPESDVERGEFWVMLDHCIGGLPEKLATTIRLVEVDELDSEEACKALGITATNLWVRLHRARLALRECIERSWFTGNRNGRN